MAKIPRLPKVPKLPELGPPKVLIGGDFPVVPPTQIPGAQVLARFNLSEEQQRSIADATGRVIPRIKLVRVESTDAAKFAPGLLAAEMLVVCL